MRIAAAVLCAALLCACGGEPSRDDGDTGAGLRIVTLAPHLAELVYSIGAGDLLVGVVAHSDYPEAAQALPVIGDAFRIDPERLADVQPDVILAWEGGNPAEVIAQLRSRGYPVLSLRADSLSDVAANLAEIGALTGNTEQAAGVAAEFLQQLEQQQHEHAGAAAVRVFYQISPQPLYTVGGRHPISDMIARCGGENVFAGLQQLAPVVSREAVVARDPQVIIAADPGGELEHWRRWGQVSAVASGSLYTVDASLVSRPSTRMLEGMQQICTSLDAARGGS